MEAGSEIGVQHVGGVLLWQGVGDPEERYKQQWHAGVVVALPRVRAADASEVHGDTREHLHADLDEELELVEASHMADWEQHVDEDEAILLKLAQRVCPSSDRSAAPC